ncbi:MAG: heavy metal-associated domain-containing protein [Acidobacteria bacterium]|nr:heavy metal-associated domain-containing protein [Acidobacteriota bacterium]
MSTRAGTLAGALLVGPWALGTGVVGASHQSGREPGMVEIVISVELSCPSCAQGLERRFSRLEHVNRVEIQVDESRVVLVLEPGTSVGLQEVWDVVRNAGFTPQTLALTAVGRLVEVNGAVALGLPDALVLALAGEHVAELATTAGQNLVEVEGDVGLGAGGSAPSVTVRRFDLR